jgi:hypothetical protein
MVKGHRKAKLPKAVLKGGCRGRKPTGATVVFKDFRLKGKKTKPKLEYLRAFLNRCTKKAIRSVLKQQSVSLNLSETPTELTAYIQQEAAFFISSNIADTNSDPSKKLKHSSFNKTCVNEYFQVKQYAVLHDKLVAFVFDRHEPSQIAEFFGYEVTSPDVSRSLKKLKLLVLSDYFKGVEKAGVELCQQIRYVDQPLQQACPVLEVALESSKGEYPFLENIL